MESAWESAFGSALERVEGWMKKRNYCWIGTSRIYSSLRAGMPEHDVARGPVSYMLFIRMTNATRAGCFRDVEFLLRNEFKQS